MNINKCKYMYITFIQLDGSVYTQSYPNDVTIKNVYDSIPNNTLTYKNQLIEPFDDILWENLGIQDDSYINIIPHKNVKFIFENENGITIENKKIHNMYSTLYDNIEHLFDIPVIMNQHGDNYTDKKIYELNDNDVVTVQELDYYIS